jgi:hypothetical protein
MPKVYFCKKQENEVICGETNIDNFEKGRYSICKECRKKELKQYKEKRKEIDLIEKKKNVDPSSNIQWLIENTIETKPIIEGKSIIVSLEETKRKLDECIEGDSWRKTNINTNFEMLNNRMHMYKERCESLETRVHILESKIEKLLKKNKIK